MCDLCVFTHCTRPNSRTVHVDRGLLYTYSLVVCGIGLLFNPIQELFPIGLPKNYSVGNTLFILELLTVALLSLVIIILLYICFPYENHEKKELFFTAL